MSDSTFLAGLLDQGGTPGVTAEDFAGPHGAALRHWQELGFLAREPACHPSPGCPHCGAGVPYHVEGRLVCNRCFDTVGPDWLLLWPFDMAAFLRWLAGACGIRGNVQQVDGVLWQLGTWADGDERFACFVRSRGVLSETGRARLTAFRQVLVLFGRIPPSETVPPSARHLSLLDVLSPEERLSAAPLASVLRPSGNVRFEPHSGALWLGDRLLGEVEPGSREHAFLACLAGQIDHFVPYREIKQAVLRETGSTDTTDEATFSQKLKSRLKKCIPAIDRLVMTTNKADGYRLRGHVGV
jgi:hypothetical protein